jgi:hypothetical protein
LAIFSVRIGGRGNLAMLWIRDTVLFDLLDPGSGSGMNIPDYISESLETIFWVKNPGSFKP